MPFCPTCKAQFDADVSVCPHDGDSLLPDHALGARDQDLADGDMAGDYRIESKLGAGGFGTVYRAIHPLIGKRAAIKVLKAQYSANPEMVSRFISEARAVNQIRQRNIVDVFAFGTLPDGRHWYAMELLEGRPLDDLLDSAGRLPAGQALAILRPSARALDAAHAAKIVHRDLKPENVLVGHDEEGRLVPKLLDFGIAKLLNADQSGPRTHTGTPIGTPTYMSPEQCRGTKVDHRSDVYSLGVMAFEMLTGDFPFDGETVMDVLMGHMQKPPPRPSEVWSELDPVFDEPLLHMLAKEPSKRPASASAAVTELEEAARQAGIELEVAPASMDAIASIPARSSQRSASTLDASGPTQAAIEPVSSASTTLEPASAQTASGGARATEGGVTVKGRYLVVGLVVMGLVATAALVRLRQEPVATSTDTTAKEEPVATESATAGAGASVPPVAAASSAVPAGVTSAMPATVAITVNVKPAGAQVLLGDHLLGPAPGPFEIERGDDKVKLSVRSSGYRPTDIEISPKAAATVFVQLKPATVKQPPGGALPPELEY